MLPFTKADDPKILYAVIPADWFDQKRWILSVIPVRQIGLIKHWPKNGQSILPFFLEKKNAEDLLKRTPKNFSKQVLIRVNFYDLPLKAKLLLYPKNYTTPTDIGIGRIKILKILKPNEQSEDNQPIDDTQKLQTLIKKGESLYFSSPKDDQHFQNGILVKKGSHWKNIVTEKKIGRNQKALDFLIDNHFSIKLVSDIEKVRDFQSYSRKGPIEES